MTVILLVLMVKTLVMIIMMFWPFDFNPLYIERLYAARVFQT